MNEEEIFLAALDRDPAERATFLDERCAGDAPLRRGVETLLKLHARANDFLKVPAVEQLVGTDPGMANTALDLSFVAPSSEPGTLGRLDQYEVLEVVGRGGMGVVLRARDTKLERIVAIKVLAQPFAASGTARQRFAREARAAAAVRDEHVVAIHAVRDNAPAPYLVMEYIEGCNLETLLRRGGPLEVKEVLRIGMQIASGLAAAHKQGLVHRDVKPANILLENGVQRVKLSDFGLARAADDARLTQSGVIAGTPLYMAPEQAAGAAIDPRADLFSLGSVLYELCVGRPAFRAPTTVAVIRRVCDEAPRPICDINPDVPEALCQLIERLHAKKPADRPASAQEVTDVLTELLAQLTRGRLRVSGGSSARQRPTRKAGPTRRKWLPVAAALTLALAGLGVVEALGLTDVRGIVIRPLAPQGIHVVEGDEAGVSASVDRGDVAIAPAAATESGLKPVANLLDPWEQSVAALPAEQQVEAVERRLRELNPEFHGKIESQIIDGKVTVLKFSTDQVTNIAPVRALKELRRLSCIGSRDRKGRLADLTPLRGLHLVDFACPENPVTSLEPLRGMPLEILHCFSTGVGSLAPLYGMKLKVLGIQATCVTDLKPLRGMPLRSLDMAWLRGVTDLTPLEGMPLTYLNISDLLVSDLSVLASLKSLDWLILDRTPVSDLRPLCGLPVTKLQFSGTRVADLTPILKLPLTLVYLDYRPEDERILRSLPGLTRINDRPAAQFWQEIAGK
jgi:hypothetical protein